MHDADSLSITLHKTDLTRYRKMSCPVRYGVYHQIRTGKWLVHCNLRGEAKYVSGQGPHWPHPGEWLKKSEAGDWIYYSSGSYYTGVFDLYGEYYLPCLQYPTNSLFRENPFAKRIVREALEFAEQAAEYLKRSIGVPHSCGDGGAGQLENRSSAGSGNKLQRILGGRISVLPPDCRHVDYDVIPLVLADGCLYNCGFCRIKTGMDFTPRSRPEIDRQLLALSDYFGADRRNYNSLFVGQHDALAAHGADILYAVERAFDIFRFDLSVMETPRLFLFGSVDSILEKEEHFFLSLNKLPYITFVNIGLESFDQQTLAVLGKPVAASRVSEAFCRINELNKRYPQVEISVNFILGDNLPHGHGKLLRQRLQGQQTGLCGKTTVYLSPIFGNLSSRRLVEEFKDIKRQSALETYLYLIQRL